MVITGGKIYTCRGPVIPKGYVVFKDGKIIQVGEGDYLGDDKEVVDATGTVVTPGFIDGHCHLGMWEEGLAFEGADGNEDTDPSTPHLRSLDAINPWDMAFQDALEYGITTVVTGPGSTNPVAGQITAMKTAGTVIDQMTVLAPCAMKFALGENPKTVYHRKDRQPSTRMAVAAVIREHLQRAQRYQEDKIEAHEKNTTRPSLDIRSEALLPVLRREIKAHFHVHRADDICTALRIIEEFNLDGVLIHCTEGYLVAGAIAKAGIPVVCGPIISTRTKPELRNMSLTNAARLMDAGVEVSVSTDAPELPIQMLSASLAMVVEGGVPAQKALELVTINAARAANIDHQVGSLESGKDADILIFEKDPITLLARPRQVIVSGKLIK